MPDITSNEYEVGRPMLIAVYPGYMRSLRGASEGSQDTRLALVRPTVRALNSCEKLREFESLYLCSANIVPIAIEQGSIKVKYALLVAFFWGGQDFLSNYPDVKAGAIELWHDLNGVYESIQDRFLDDYELKFEEYLEVFRDGLDALGQDKNVLEEIPVSPLPRNESSRRIPPMRRPRAETDGIFFNDVRLLTQPASVVQSLNGIDTHVWSRMAINPGSPVPLDELTALPFIGTTDTLFEIVGRLKLLLNRWNSSQDSLDWRHRFDIVVSNDTIQLNVLPI